MSGVRAFLEGIIDYAGLFPPAELPLDQAVANYARYRRESTNWMLARFICPAVRLKELQPFREQLGKTRLAVLGRGGKDLAEFTANFGRDLADILDLPAGFDAESFEVKLPAGWLEAGPPEEIARLINDVVERLQPVKATPFFECPELKPKLVDHLAAGLRLSQGRKAGWKLRCGGLQPAAFPAPQQVAQVLAECCSSGIAWKATAGLHHPLRHFDSKLATSMHGFVNVFGAAILTHARRLTVAQIEEMLADEDAGHFSFDETGFAWKKARASLEEIQRARSQLAKSFGSCSFAEPCDDLRRLGWLR